MLDPRLVVFCSIAFVGSAQPSGTVLLSADLADGFYGNEPPFEVDGAPWLGLIADGDAYSLRPVALEWVGLTGPAGADGPTYALTSDPSGALVLFSAVAGLAEGEMRGAEPGMVDLAIGAPTADIVLGTKRYHVSVESSYPDQCTAVVTLSDEEVSQSLPVEGILGCGDPHFAIHWAGDLDGDEALDFVATFSMKYSYHPRQLYLSSRAGPGELVALAALTDRTAS